MVTFRFEICTLAQYSAWPTHARLISESHLKSATSVPIFSKEMARKMLKQLVDAGFIDGDAAGALDSDIGRSKLPADRTSEDLLFDHVNLQLAHFIVDKRYGALPPDDGAGETRIAKCEGACGHANCGRYPTHAALFLKGISKAVGLPIFSHERAVALINDGIKLGTLTPKDEDVLIDQLDGIQLEKKKTRADRMATVNSPRLPEFLTYLFEIEPLPEGAKPVSFAACDSDHGHFVIFGHEDSESVFSRSSAHAFLTTLTDHGFIASSDVERVIQEINASGLPEISEIEEIGEELYGLFGRLKSLARN